MEERGVIMNSATRGQLLMLAVNVEHARKVGRYRKGFCFCHTFYVISPLQYSSCSISHISPLWVRCNKATHFFTLSTLFNDSSCSLSDISPLRVHCTKATYNIVVSGSLSPQFACNVLVVQQKIGTEAAGGSHSTTPARMTVNNAAKAILRRASYDNYNNPTNPSGTYYTRISFAVVHTLVINT